MAVMAKEPQSASGDDERTPDGHRHPAFQLRLDPRLMAPMRELAHRNARKITEEIRTAIREYLERKGLWPPPPESD